MINKRLLSAGFYFILFLFWVLVFETAKSIHQQRLVSNFKRREAEPVGYFVLVIKSNGFCQIYFQCSHLWFYYARNDCQKMWAWFWV